LETLNNYYQHESPDFINKRINKVPNNNNTINNIPYKNELINGEHKSKNVTVNQEIFLNEEINESRFYHQQFPGYNQEKEFNNNYERNEKSAETNNLLLAAVGSSIE
jgi:hypothetical protein